MNDFSGPVDKKTAKALLKLCRKTIPVMTLLDAYTIQAILHGAERRAKERNEKSGPTMRFLSRAGYVRCAAKPRSHRDALPVLIAWKGCGLMPPGGEQRVQKSRRRRTAGCAAKGIRICVLAAGPPDFALTVENLCFAAMCAVWTAI